MCARECRLPIASHGVLVGVPNDEHLERLDGANGGGKNEPTVQSVLGGGLCRELLSRCTRMGACCGRGVEARRHDIGRVEMARRGGEVTVPHSVWA